VTVSQVSNSALRFDFLRFWRGVIIGYVPFHLMVALFVAAVKHSVPVVVNAGFYVPTNTAFGAELVEAVVGVNHGHSGFVHESSIQDPEESWRV